VTGSKDLGNNSNTKPGIQRQKAPSIAAYLLIGLVVVFVIAVNYYTSSNNRGVSPVLLMLSFLVYPLAAVIVIFIIIKFRKDQKYIITSAEALHGYFLMDKIWAYMIGLPSVMMCLGTAVNGYYSLAIPFAFIFVLDIAAVLYFKRGLRIDNSGNIFYVKQSYEMLIDFNYLKQVSFVHSYSLRRYELTFYFDNTIRRELPSKILIVVSRLIAAEYRSRFNYIILGEFIKSRCINAGFTITDIDPDMEDCQWTAQKLI